MPHRNPATRALSDAFRKSAKTITIPPQKNERANGRIILSLARLAANWSIHSNNDIAPKMSIKKKKSHEVADEFLGPSTLLELVVLVRFISRNLPDGLASGDHALPGPN